MAAYPSEEDLANAHGTDLYLVRQIFELQAISTKDNLFWERTEALDRKELAKAQKSF